MSNKQEAPISVKKEEGITHVYATGAVAQRTPFDFRVIFHTHEASVRETTPTSAVLALSPVFQVEVIMSHAVAKQVRDLIVSQLEEKDADKPKEK